MGSLEKDGFGDKGVRKKSLGNLVAVIEQELTSAGLD